MAKFEFGFKEAWFRLIIKKLPDHPDLFLSREVEKAQALLRIGRIKVGAARVWAEAAGLISKKNNEFFLSPLGKLIARHDPDLEEDGIWWLIHYHFARINSMVWFYQYYVNGFEYDEFNHNDLESGIRSYWDKKHDLPMADSVYKKQIFPSFKQFLIGTDDEEGTRLGEKFGFLSFKNNTFTRNTENAPNIPKAIFAYALIDWGRQHGRQSVHLEKLLEPGGVGRIFRLDRDTLDTLLVDIGEVYQKQAGWISHTAGLNSVSIPSIPPLAMVSAYYHELDGEEPAGALTKCLEEEKQIMG